MNIFKIINITNTIYSPFILLTLILCLTGCECWPPGSNGGYAAHYLLTDAYKKELQGPYYELSSRYEKLTQELCGLQKTHARFCYPSRFRLLGLLDQQISQEIGAGLCQSAHYDLILFEKNLAEIHRFNLKKGCPIPKPTLNWEILKSRIT